MRWFLCLLVAIHAVAGASDDPVDSLPWPSRLAVGEVRIASPAYIVGDRAEVVVEAGRGVVGGDPGMVEIVVPGGIARSATLSWRSDDRQGRSVGTAIVGTGGLPDGPVELRARVGARRVTATAAVITGAFMDVRRDRDEVGEWIVQANRPDPIWGRRPRWSGLAAALARPEDPFGDLTGHVLRSYRSPHLEGRQPYLLHIPATLDRHRPAPLLVLLHGSGGDWRNLIADEAAGQRFSEAPMLIANAGILRYREYRHLALQDVLAVVADVSAKYAVDPDRIHLQGISLGGRGALEAPALLPDRFASVSAQGVYGMVEPLVDPVAMTALDPLALRLMARADLRSWLPNLAGVPVEMVSGLQDLNTPPYNGLLFSDLIRQGGGTAIDRVFPTDHNISLPAYDWATTRRWMLDRRRPATRAVIVHRASCLRYGRSGWVEIQALSDPAAIGEVRARWVPATTAALPTVITISTRDLRRLRIDPPGPADRLVVDGVDLGPVPSTAPVAVAWTAGRPARIDPAAPLDGKRAGRSGPLWDAWSDPVTYVADDTDPVAMASATASARWDLTGAIPSLPVRTLPSLTAAERRERTLIVFTRDAAACPLLAGAGIPVELADPGTAAVAVVLRPSPWSPDRMVVAVVNRTGHPFDLDMLGHWDQRLHGDWLRFGWPAEDDGWIETGVFDHDWGPGPSTRTDIGAEILLGPKARGD